MPLLDLKTDLKSLKYGNDQLGGGNSGQPYVTTDINTVDTGFNRFRMTKFDDGLVRGGIVGATNASVVDTIRIGKFLKDFPKGPLFIAKQVGLQFSNPRLETKKLGTGIGFLDNSINFVKDNLGLQPTRIYNLGINTLAQVPVNAFGVHFNRHGLLPVQDEQTKYLAVAQYNNTQQGGKNNRLVLLANKFNLGKNNNISLNTKETKTLLNTLFAAGELAANVLFNGILQPVRTSKIDDYFGGPKSVYGLGRTLISRYDYSRTADQANEDKKNPYRIINDINYRNDLGVSNQYFPGSNVNIIQPGATYGRTNAPKTKIQTNSNDTGSIRRASIIDPGITPISRNASYQTYQKIIESKNLREKKYTDGINDINTFGIYGNSLPGGIVKDLNNRILPDSNQSPVYYSSNSNKILVTLKPWKEINREIRVGSGIQDSINLTPIFSSTGSLSNDTVTISGKEYNINDLVKFRIQALNGDDPTQSNYMIFRAYLTQFSDNTDATWNPVKYVGRGEDFYIYNGFTRKIQIGFKVAALSAEEMEPMYQKLNYLMGNLMPDYKDNLLMRGPLVKMTVGNWLDGQDGILTSLSYTVPNDSPWEIALNGINFDKLLVLPHIVEVNLSFTPIGSQTKGVNKISEKRLNTSHIAQNNNEYQYIK